MEDKKKIWESKTFLIGCLTVFIGVLTALQGELSSGVGLSALGVVNIVLRLVTDTKVVLK